MQDDIFSVRLDARELEALTGVKQDGIFSVRLDARELKELRS